MSSSKPDLILNDETEYVPRKVTLDVSQIRPGKLTLLEALDMAEASDVDPNDFTDVLSRGSAARKARLIYAFAWVLARRTEPELTFAEVCTYDLTVQGKPLTNEHAKDARRAQAITAVAQIAQVSPREAEQLTLAEVQAISDRVAAHNVKPQRIRRRRAG